MLQLEMQKVRLQAEALDIEKQRLKWLRFRNKKDRELEKFNHYGLPLHFRKQVGRTKAKDTNYVMREIRKHELLRSLKHEVSSVYNT